jgi:hypothetical protein
MVHNRKTGLFNLADWIFYPKKDLVGEILPGLFYVVLEQKIKEGII